MSKRIKRLKVLHCIVNYGTQAGLFAKGIRENGIKALSVSYSDKYKRVIDIELLHGGNFIQKLTKHIWNWIRKLYWFFEYNTFHFYYGTSLFPYQLDLPLYRLFRKKVIMHYLGNDVQGYKKSVEQYKWTNMPGFIGNNDAEKYDLKILKRLVFETKYVDLQIVCAPCYSDFVKNSIVLPLAIDINSYSYVDHPQNNTLIIMHAPTHRGSKGTEYIIGAIQKLISEGHQLKLNLVENTPHNKLKEEYIKSDFFIDQIMSGWYGTASLEAMALGRPVVCSIRKSYFEHIDYGHKIPIIHADPDCIYDSIKYMIENRAKLPELGRISRKFVEDIHDSRKLSKVLIGYYHKIWLQDVWNLRDS